MAALKILDRREGYPFNFLPARPDRLAKGAVESIYGDEFVQQLESRYHRSELSFDALRDDFLQYDRKHAPCERDEAYKMIFTSVMNEIRTEAKIIPYTTGAVPLLPDFPRQKSAGLPYKLRGIRTKQDAVDAGGIESNRKLWHEISYSKRRIDLPDVCLYARAQVCDVSKNKIRATWGYPFDVYVEEARFFYPILDYISSDECRLPIAYGLEIANGAMAEVNRVHESLKSKVVMTDWKMFDKTIPPWLIRDAFAILASIIDFARVKSSDGVIFDVRPERSLVRWKRLVDYFVSTPVRLSNGERYLVTGGVPSGSCFTNIIDTIVNILVTRYLFYQTTGQLPLSEIYLGDDGVCFTQAIVDLDNMAKLAEERFGMLLSPEKSYVTTNPQNIHFLGYYNMGGIPFKPQDTLLASFIAPERTRHTVEEAAAAALGQLWSSLDPVAASYWVKILDYMDRQYSFNQEEVLQHMRVNIGRHKYLKLIGLSLDDIKWPTPSDSGVVLETMVRNRCRKRMRINNWILDELYQETLAYWLDEET